MLRSLFSSKICAVENSEISGVGLETMLEPQDLVIPWNHRKESWVSALVLWTGIGRVTVHVETGRVILLGNGSGQIIYLLH